MIGADTGSILTTAIFYLLCGEIFLVALLCVPMPSFLKRPLLKAMGSGAFDAAVTPMKWLFGLILVFFVDAVRRMLALQEMVHNNRMMGDNIAVLKDNEAKKYRAERNFYLAGSLHPV